MINIFKWEKVCFYFMMIIFVIFFIKLLDVYNLINKKVFKVVYVYG